MLSFGDIFETLLLGPRMLVNPISVTSVSVMTSEQPSEPSTGGSRYGSVVLSKGHSPEDKGAHDTGRQSVSLPMYVEISCLPIYS
jgi:hypothetical protein